MEVICLGIWLNSLCQIDARERRIVHGTPEVRPSLVILTTLTISHLQANDSGRRSTGINETLGHAIILQTRHARVGHYRQHYLHSVNLEETPDLIEMLTDIPLSDYIAVNNIGFEWVQSYDLKDWDRLRMILAPTVTLDFRGIKEVGTLFENLTPDAYVAILSSPGVLGNPRLKTQHHVGAKKHELLDDGRIRVDIQLRVAHQLYNNDELTSVRNKGHAHGVATHIYQKIEGKWKLAQTASTSEWVEFDLLGTLAGKESAVQL